MRVQDYARVPISECGCLFPHPRLPRPSEYGVKKLQWGFFCSEPVGPTGLMLPLLLLGFICLFVNQSWCVKDHQEGVTKNSGVRGRVPVCRELPQPALLSTPTSEGWVPGLGLPMGEVESLAQVVGLAGCLGPEMRLREQREHDSCPTPRSQSGCAGGFHATSRMNADKESKDQRLAQRPLSRGPMWPLLSINLVPESAAHLPMVQALQM